MTIYNHDGKEYSMNNDSIGIINERLKCGCSICICPHTLLTTSSKQINRCVDCRIGHCRGLNRSNQPNITIPEIGDKNYYD